MRSAVDFLREMSLVKSRLEARQAALRQEKLRTRAIGDDKAALEAVVKESERKVRAREAEACKFERFAEAKEQADF